MQDENQLLNRQQGIRRRQVLTATAVYLTALLPLAWINHLDMVLLTDDQKLFGIFAVLVTNAVFYLLIHFDLNLHLRDPSMTFAQVLVANAWSLIIAWIVAQPARPLAMTWYLLAFLFGVYTLQRRQFLVLTSFALSGYLAVVAREYFAGTAESLRIEILHWIILAAGLFWMALVGGYVSSLRSRLVAQRRELADVAFVDPLTNVYNRRYLLDVLEREIARIRRGHVATLSIGLVDLDHFKHVNDRYGHLMGDQVLRRLGDAMKDEMRSMDAVGRFGGEEFLVVMPDTGEQGAQISLNRMRRRVEMDEIGYRGVKIPVTLSAGVAELEHNESAQSLIDRADKALYAAKEAGRNRVVEASKLGGRSLRVVPHPRARSDNDTA